VSIPVSKTGSNCSFASFEVHLGALNFNDESEAGRVIVTSDQVMLHENYNGIIINNDIAIIHLPKAVSGPSIHQLHT
jgi:secreted trypsin-like serine protease